MKIELDHLRKTFGTTTVLDDISLAIEPNEMFFLLGPSGCGKTTLLRILAGFIAADSGEVRFDGQRVNDLPPEKRRAPMVFQSYALWPHLSVLENTAYGLRVMGRPEAEVQSRALDALDAVRMRDHAGRAPNQLSGGQQQRVAIARALATAPGALLFDEPLSNLDAGLRVEMREELREIHQRHPFTGVYVTHDQEEAMTLATRIAVMQQGRIRQVGTPREIYSHPKDRFVAEFMGAMNWLPARVRTVESAGRLTLETSFGLAPNVASSTAMTEGTNVLMGFRPASTRIGDRSSPDNLVMEGAVLRTQYVGVSQRLWIRLPAPFDLLQVIESPPGPTRRIGEPVEVSVSHTDLMVLPAATSM